MAQKLLQTSPWNRSSAEEVLALPYLSTYHDPAIEPTCPLRVQFDADAIEELLPQQLTDALDFEANLFEAHRGPYHTRTDPPSPLPEEDKPISSTNSAADERRSPNQNAKRNYSIIGRSAKAYRLLPSTPLFCESLPESAETVLEMETTNRNTHFSDSPHSDMLNADEKNDSMTRTELSECLREGTNWRLEEASTSSAPPTINRDILHTKHIPRNALERRLLMRDMKSRDGILRMEKRKPPIRPKDRGRLNNDVIPADKLQCERRGKLRKSRSRPNLQRRSRDEQRMLRSHQNNDVRKGAD